MVRAACGPGATLPIHFIVGVAFDRRVDLAFFRAATESSGIVERFDRKGLDVTPIGASLGAAALLAGAFFCQPASAAAGGDTDTIEELPSAGLTLPQDYALDTEMVVSNWVLCVSRAFAEELVEARKRGIEAALETYEGLKGSKSCGQFVELRVILQTRLTAVSIDRQSDARVFQALVNLSGSWASAFVVSGGLPD